MQSETNLKNSGLYYICKHNVQKIYEATNASKNEGYCGWLNVGNRRCIHYKVTSSLYITYLIINCNRSLLFLEKRTISILWGFQKNFDDVFCFSGVWTQQASTLCCKLRQLEYKLHLQWLRYNLSIHPTQQDTMFSTHVYDSSMPRFYTNVARDHEYTSESCNDFTYRILSSYCETLKKILSEIEKRHKKCLTFNRCLFIKHLVICSSKKEIHDRISYYAEHYARHNLSVATNKITLFNIRISWNRPLHQQEMNDELATEKKCCKIRNGIASFGKTSNHKLKPMKEFYKATVNPESVRHRKCNQQFSCRSRSENIIKIQWRALLFLIIMCIQQLTVASSVHNLKYSTNIVKTKYGMYITKKLNL